jgi:hypothetical protein
VLGLCRLLGEERDGVVLAVGGPIALVDQMLGVLLEAWEQRYKCGVDIERLLALFTRGGKQSGD